MKKSLALKLLSLPIIIAVSINSYIKSTSVSKYEVSKSAKNGKRLSKSDFSNISAKIPGRIIDRSRFIDSEYDKISENIDSYTAKISNWRTTSHGDIYVKRYQNELIGLKSRQDYLLQQKNALKNLKEEIDRNKYKINIIQFPSYQVYMEVIDNSQRIYSTDNRRPEITPYEAVAHDVILGLAPAVLGNEALPIDGILLRGEAVVYNPTSGKAETVRTYEYEISPSTVRQVEDFDQADVNKLIEQVLKPTVWRF